MLDIDFFKDVNDTYGHLVGDEILIMLCENVMKNLRQSDSFARWGGEEFVILFTNTNIKNALISTENFRKIIKSHKHQGAGNITVSFGLTEYKQGDTIESIIDRADKALYEAKHSGRDCVKSFL